jgi:hypothetical protein
VTLLEEFIYSLNKTERARLRPLQFRGAKRKIFLVIRNRREPGGIDLEQLIRSLKISKKRFYQTLTEILHACYYDLAPGGGTELLQYLGNMQLYRHFYQEMQRQEKILIESNNRKALEEFYFKTLLMSEFFLMPPQLEGKIRPELARYLLRYSEIKEPHPCDHCFLECSEIDEEISDNFRENFSLSKLRASTEKLETLFKCLEGHDHALAKFKVTYALAMIYFGNYFPDKRPEPYIENLYKILEDHADVFGSLTELIRLGIQSYSAPTETDIESYKKFLGSQSNTGEGSSLVFIERFLPLIVKAGEFEWAKKFIDDRFPIAIDLLRKDIAVHWWRLVMIYHVYNGEFQQAEMCLEKAIAANTGKLRYTDISINLRCYAIFLSIMQHGPDLAADMVMRHIRYARRHGYNKGEGFMMLFMRSVHELVSIPVFDKERAQKVKDKYRKELKKEERQYPLFERIYNKYYA